MTHGETSTLPTTVLPLAVAVTVTVVVDAICAEVMLNGALVPPEGIVTELGMVTNVPLCVSDTAPPDEPAAPLSVTVPVAEPVTAVNDDGAMERRSEEHTS